MENKELIKQEPLTAAQVKTNVKTLQEILEKVMLKDVHYGVVPGCGNKPALLKAGAEKIMSTFRLSADPVVADLSTSDCCRYRVTLRLLAIDGTFCGAGVGEASTDEEKYKWRRAVCQAEFSDTDETRRRIKYNKDGTKTEQVRTNPSDLANTVLKMAKKRALVDAVLTATAASDLFEQDIEDMDPDLIQREGAPVGKPQVKMPQPKPAPVEPKPESSASDFAQDIVNEFDGVPETEYMTVSQAQACKPGDTVSVQAKVVGVYTKKVGANKDKTKTDYLVTDGTNKIFIGIFGEAIDGAKDQECYFTAVKISEYQGKQQYLCEGGVCSC